MSETFFTLNDGSPRAIVGIRRRSNGTVQPLDDAVPDGDTAGVQFDGTGSVRFLGIDTPEKSFEQPLGGSQKLDGAQWEQFLTNPLANGFPATLLEPPLAAHLQSRFGSGAAATAARRSARSCLPCRGAARPDERSRSIARRTGPSAAAGGRSSRSAGTPARAGSRATPGRPPRP